MLSIWPGGSRRHDDVNQRELRSLDLLTVAVIDVLLTRALLSSGRGGGRYCYSLPAAVTGSRKKVMMMDKGFFVDHYRQNIVDVH